MAQRIGRKALIVGASLLALAGAACWYFSEREPTPPAAARWLDFEPSAAQEKKLQELRASLRPGERRFPKEVRRERDSAQLFMYLAGTSDDERIVVAALDAVQATYASRSSQKAAPDRDLERVLIKQLASESPACAQAAFEAARIPLMARQPTDALVSELIRLASRGKTAGVRLAALDALNHLPPDRRSATVLQTFLEHSEDEPTLALTALHGLWASARSLEQTPALSDLARKKLETLARSGQPALRGMGLQVLVQMGPPSKDAVPALARPLLGDSDPYVRGMAAWSLGRAGDASDIHALVPLVSDRAEARTAVHGPPRLDGTPAEIPSKVPGARFVAEAALFAVKALAAPPPSAPPGSESAGSAGWDAPPRLTIGGPTSGLPQVEESAQLVRAWYEDQRDHLPHQPSR